MTTFSHGFWDNPGPDEGWSWIVMIGAMFTAMTTFGFSNTGGAGLLYSEIIRVFDVTREEAIWPFSMVFILQSFSGLFSSLLTSIFSIRLLFVISSLACSMSLILCYWATDVLYITFTFGVLFGFGAGLGFNLAGGLICKYFAKYRSTVNGMLFVGSPLGGFVYPLLVNYILSQYDLRSSMLLLGGALLHMLIIALLMRSRTPGNFRILKEVEEPQQKLLKDTKQLQDGQLTQEQSDINRTKIVSVKSTLKQYVDILREPNFYLVSLQQTICVHVTSGVNITLNDYLLGKGISRTIILTTLSVFSVFDAVGRLGAGFFCDRAKINPRKVVIVTMLIQGSCTLFLCLTTNVYANYFIISLLALMAGTGASLPNILYCKYLGLNNIYTTLSLSSFLVGIVGIVRPSVIGICRDVLGSYDYFYFLLGGCSILSSVLWLLYPCMKKKESGQERADSKIVCFRTRLH